MAEAKATPKRESSRKRVRPPDTVGKAHRPDLLTEDVAKRLIETLAIGTPLKYACAYAGISDLTLRNWRQKGSKALELPASKRSPTERRYAKFVKDLDLAVSETFIRAQATVRQVMVVGNEADSADKRVALEAAKFHLTHRAPKDYSTQTRTELTGANGAPLRIDMTGEEAAAAIAEFMGAAFDEDDE